jgi:predicted phage terminase large subunit-like protein
MASVKEVGRRYSERELLDAGLREDFHAFVQKVVETVSPGTRFSPNWHIEAMAHQLERVARGELTRLIINVPPRHLKSICASVALPAYILGHDPAKRIICVSYADELAKKFANDCRAVMRSDWYQRIFPRTRIDRSKDTETEFQTTKRGHRLSTSVGGVLTGRGGDIVIIDDPIKPQDAQSKVARDRVLQWFENTLLSRLDDKQKSAIVLVMQRVHIDDLTGYLLEKRGFEHLCLPAIAKVAETFPVGHGRVHIRSIGDVLDSKREPSKTLEGLRQNMTPMTFSAQYLQEPVALGGNLIKWEWVKFFQGNVPFKRGAFYIISWDTAMKSSQTANYSVGTVWQIQNGCSYLLDVVRGRFEFPELVSKAKALYQSYFPYGPVNLLIEDKGSGTSLIQALKDHGIYAQQQMKLTGDKVMRMEAQSVYFTRGSVCFLEGAPWLEELKAELLAFPNGRYDDQVDSISQALSYLTWLDRHSYTITHVSY